MKKKGRVENLKYKYYLLCNPDEIELPEDLSEQEQKVWIKTIEEAKEKLEKKIGTKTIQKIGKKIEKVKYNYRLIMKPERIRMPKDLTEKEQERWKRKLYQKKYKLHEKLGARWFQNIVGKYDQKKFWLLNKVRNRKRSKLLTKLFPNRKKKEKPSIIDRFVNYREKELLKKATTEEQIRIIKEETIRNKNIIKKQIKEGKSVNYYEGVDRRVELFPDYLKLNKKHHQNALKKDMVVIGICIGVGLLGMPVLPWIVGSYQALDVIKDLQCINLQEYNLARIKTIEKKLVARNMQKMQQMYNENQEAIESLQKAKQQGKDIYTVEGLLDSLDSVEALQQLRKSFLETKEEKNGQSPQLQRLTDEELEQRIIPKETEGQKPNIQIRRR